jgi:hypothetical protein
MRLLLIGLAAVLALALVAAAACGDDDDDDGDGGNGAAAEQALLDAQRAQVLATMTTFRVEGLHDIDETAQEASEIEAGWSGAIGRLRQAVAGVDWPADLADGGAGLEAALVACEESLDAEDLASFKTDISDAHGVWHDFEHAAYAFVAGEEHSEDDGHGDEAETTDGAEESEGEGHGG